ncbi:MAG: hypothetical protein IPN08_15770 [Bacteroidales bacterium]|nr:hypothetical protein [Bacteroidales bacterium]
MLDKEFDEGPVLTADGIGREKAKPGGFNIIGPDFFIDLEMEELQLIRGESGGILRRPAFLKGLNDFLNGELRHFVDGVIGFDGGADAGGYNALGEHSENAVFVLA